MPSFPMKCGILILNCNGLQHLKECIPSILNATAYVPDGCHVIVVDNASTDESVVWLRNEYPQVEVVISEKNNYLFSLNKAVASMREDIVIILNNDMHFDRAFISALLVHFNDPDVFAAGSSVLDWDGLVHTVGQRLAKVQRFWFYKWYEFGMKDACLSLDICGGAFACRRSMFLELGGFDDLYRPGYYEDLDLSFRAYQRGWKIIFEPKSVVYHRESASMLKYLGEKKKAVLLYRNHILFIIKNVGGRFFLFGFLLLLPIRMLRPLFYGDTIPFRGSLEALFLLPRTLKRRMKRSPSLISYSEILKKIMGNKVAS